MNEEDLIDPIPEEEKDPVEVPNIPNADVDFMDVAKAIVVSWLANPQITLVYITQSEFDAKVGQFSSDLMQRKDKGSDRSEFTVKLEQADDEIDKSIEHIKGYLNEKYTKKIAPSYYAQFGIEKVGKIYKLPYDHDERKAALELLIPSLTVHGFQTNLFGLTYWTDLQTRYNNYLAQSITIDGSVSEKVGDKNLLKKEIKKVLNSLLRVLEGNYPDNHKNVKRTWGFQKEKY